MSTVAIILAADSGSGFVGPKYLADIRGKPMLQWVVDSCMDWPVEERIVVLGSEADRIVDAVDFGDMTVVIDSEWSEGSASPLRAALDLASRDQSVSACVIARGDQPDVKVSTVAALLEVAADTEADTVVPQYRYVSGWPIILDYSIWEHLLAAEGSVDLPAVAASHATSPERVWFDHLPPKTYESPDDLA